MARTASGANLVVEDRCLACVKCTLESAHVRLVLLLAAPVVLLPAAFVARGLRGCAAERRQRRPDDGGCRRGLREGFAGAALVAGLQGRTECECDVTGESGAPPRLTVLLASTTPVSAPARRGIANGAWPAPPWSVEGGRARGCERGGSAVAPPRALPHHGSGGRGLGRKSKGQQLLRLALHLHGLLLGRLQVGQRCG